MKATVAVVRKNHKTTLVLLRHGQSEWNLENRFTGWIDVDLSVTGIKEAESAAEKMIAAGITFDMAFTSYLKRAIKTLWIVQEKMDLMWIPGMPDWRLNERHYGSLQGKHKDEIYEKYGGDQVVKWRRGFSECPPSLKDKHLHKDHRYLEVSVPTTESLENSLIRILPCWENQIQSALISGSRVLVVSHGNTIRALIKHIEQLNAEQIAEIEVKTGEPILYEFDGHLLSAERKKIPAK